MSLENNPDSDFYQRNRNLYGCLSDMPTKKKIVPSLKELINDVLWVEYFLFFPIFFSDFDINPKQFLLNLASFRERRYAIYIGG